MFCNFKGILKYLFFMTYFLFLVVLFLFLFVIKVFFGLSFWNWRVCLCFFSKGKKKYYGVCNLVLKYLIFWLIDLVFFVLLGNFWFLWYVFDFEFWCLYFIFLLVFVYLYWVFFNNIVFNFRKGFLNKNAIYFSFFKFEGCVS